MSTILNFLESIVAYILYPFITFTATMIHATNWVRLFIIAQWALFIYLWVLFTKTVTAIVLFCFSLHVILFTFNQAYRQTYRAIIHSFVLAIPFLRNRVNNNRTA